MEIMLFLGVTFLMFQLRFSACEEFIPQDGVTLGNLSVSDQGVVEVDIIIKDFTDKPDLTAVLINQHSCNDSFEVPLKNFTHLSSTNLISSTIEGLQQDLKYSIFLESNESRISNNYTLVTTGLQAITSTANGDVVCKFLPNSRANECLVEWRPMNLIGGEAGYTIISRVQDQASIHLQSLILGITYQVHGFGLHNNNKLHMFPIMMEGTLMVQTTDTAVTRALGVMTASSGSSLDIDTLVPILSGVLGGIIVFMFVLICIIIAIIKCPKKVHSKMSEDVEKTLTDIQTLSNICYGEISESSEPPAQERKNVKSIHLYDDIVAASALYENVDPETGLPTVPKPVTSSCEKQLKKSPVCERACLPLKGIAPPGPLRSNTQRSTKKGQSSLGRARTFNHKQCKAPSTQKFATLSVVLEAADYETPIENMRITAL